MRVFFDTEFTGLHKNTTLISIGLISGDGKRFYAELKDYDPNQCDEWIEENVLKNLYFKKYKINDSFFPDNECMFVSGDKNRVGEKLSEWFSQFDNVQLISDVCHYDMVLLIDLFGSAFDLPKNVSPVCHDINQDIAKHYHITEKHAFDKSREEIVKELCGKEINGDKHNALYDAKVIKTIYEELRWSSDEDY